MTVVVIEDSILGVAHSLLSLHKSGSQSTWTERQWWWALGRCRDYFQDLLHEVVEAHVAAPTAVHEDHLSSRIELTGTVYVQYIEPSF